MIKEYWNLIGQEPFLAIIWEPHFSQAYSFLRIWISHKNFHFTQIPDKTNDEIFLKSPKPCFGRHFDHFWSFFLDGDFFQKIQLCHTTYMGPWHQTKFQKKLMSQFRENLKAEEERIEGQMEGQTEGQTLFYRTLLKEARGPKMKNVTIRKKWSWNKAAKTSNKAGEPG